MKKYLTWSVMLLLVVALVAVSANCGGEEEEEAYLIGALFDTTGAASTLGVAEDKTVDIMVDNINEAGGINGHELKVQFYNTEGTSETAILVAENLINDDKVLAIIGPSRSGTSLALKDTVTTAKIPMVSCAASTLIVEPIEESYWVFKTPQTDQEAITTIYEYLQVEGYTDIAILTDTSGFGAAGKAILEADALDYGLTIVEVQTFDNGDPNVDSQLTKIEGTDAQVVICWSTVKDSTTVAAGMEALDIPLICSHGIAHPDFITIAGDAANGVIFPAGKVLIVDELPADDPQKESVMQYRDDFEAEYGTGTVSTFGGHAYDALSLVVLALDEMEEGLDLADARAAIRDGIENITGFAGTAGVFSMSANDHYGLPPGTLEMITIVDGEWTWLQ
jgi:branched-chain amino acid transport system substrate-binding protein